MVVMHHASLAEALARRPQAGQPRADWRRMIDGASLFLCEALSPFEITHKGFREATEVTRRVLWLASVVSHELKTPLTGVLNSAGMLRDVLAARAGGGEAGRGDAGAGAGAAPTAGAAQTGAAAGAGIEARLLENVLTSAQVLKARTDEFADLVGLHSGSLSLRFGNVEVAEVVRSVAQRMEAEAAAAGMAIATAVDPDLPSILADGPRLEQVLSNLIQNAIKYGSEGRRVDVRARIRADTLVLEVQDYGAGISLWDRMSLFQPFFRGERGSKEVPGVGLGLALCRELVELHHGEISVETEEGKGSLFRVELPIGTPTGWRTGPG
jgi:signal transduction histidine kinase